jgi:TPR repeat protein
LRHDQNKFFKQNQTMNTKQNQTINTSKCTYPKAMVSAAWVAELYEKGWGVGQDYSKAHKWFEKAADDGNTGAMIHLGCLYEQGLGVAQDYGKALEWFQKAVDAGNTDTMINLDQLYENGLGI